MGSRHFTLSRAIPTPSIHQAHHPDVIPAGSAEYLPSGAVFTASQRITAQGSTAYRYASAARMGDKPNYVTPNFVGLADAQTALFTQPVS